jgi:thiamine transport system substrate-binding protein
MIRRRHPFVACLVLVSSTATLLHAPASAESPAGSSPAKQPQPTAPQRANPSEVTLLATDSFALSDDVLATFQSQHGVPIQVLRVGDAGAMVNQAILSKDHPFADVLYGIDNTFLSRALDAGIFEPYAAADLDALPTALKLDPQARVTPVDYGDVCVVIDLKAFGADGLPTPSGLHDLTRPSYKGKLVVENPATSSPGLAFLLATVDTFGETGDYTWHDYWRDLRANDVAVTSGWDEAYYSTFSGGSDGSGAAGDRPIVVSYGTDPAAAVFGASPAPDTSPLGLLRSSCFRQVEFAGVLAGTDDRDLAHALIDFLISQPVQEDIPPNMYVLPALPSAQLPDAFARFNEAPSQPLTMDPALIGANRERWIGEWTDLVLH